MEHQQLAGAPISTSLHNETFATASLEAEQGKCSEWLALMRILCVLVQQVHVASLVNEEVLTTPAAGQFLALLQTDAQALITSLETRFGDMWRLLSYQVDLTPFNADYLFGELVTKAAKISKKLSLALQRAGIEDVDTSDLQSMLKTYESKTSTSKAYSKWREERSKNANLFAASNKGSRVVASTSLSAERNRSQSDSAQSEYRGRLSRIADAIEFDFGQHLATIAPEITLVATTGSNLGGLSTDTSKVKSYGDLEDTINEETPVERSSESDASASASTTHYEVSEASAPPRESMIPSGLDDLEGGDDQSQSSSSDLIESSHSEEDTHGSPSYSRSSFSRARPPRSPPKDETGESSNSQESSALALITPASTPIDESSLSSSKDHQEDDAPAEDPKRKSKLRTAMRPPRPDHQDLEVDGYEAEHESTPMRDFIPEDSSPPSPTDESSDLRADSMRPASSPPSPPPTKQSNAIGSYFNTMGPSSVAKPAQKSSSDISLYKAPSFSKNPKLRVTMASHWIKNAETDHDVPLNAVEALVAWSQVSDEICALVFASPYLNWLLSEGPLLPTPFDSLDKNYHEGLTFKQPGKDTSKTQAAGAVGTQPANAQGPATGGKAADWKKTPAMIEALNRASKRIDFFRRTLTPDFQKKHGYDPTSSRELGSRTTKSATETEKEPKEGRGTRTVSKRCEAPPPSPSRAHSGTLTKASTSALGEDKSHVKASSADNQAAQVPSGLAKLFRVNTQSKGTLLTEAESKKLLAAEAAAKAENLRLREREHANWMERSNSAAQPSSSHSTAKASSSMIKIESGKKKAKREEKLGRTLQEGTTPPPRRARTEASRGPSSSSTTRTTKAPSADDLENVTRRKQQSDKAPSNTHDRTGTGTSRSQHHDKPSSSAPNTKTSKTGSKSVVSSANKKSSPNASDAASSDKTVPRPPSLLLNDDSVDSPWDKPSATKK